MGTEPVTRPPPEALRRFGLNVRASVAYQGVSIAFSLVTLPIIVRALGADAYGLWSLIAAVYACVGVTELVLSATTVRFVAEAHGRGALADARALHDFLWRTAVSWGLLISVGLALQARWIITAWLHLPPARHALALFVLWCQLAALPWRMTLTVDAGAIQAHQRLDLSTAIGVGYIIVENLGTVTFACLGWGLRAVAAWEACVLCGSAVAHGVVARRLMAPLAQRLTPRQGVAQLAPFAWRIFVGMVASSLLLPASRLLVGRYRALTDVAFFTLATKLASEASALATHIGSVTMPAASDLAGRQDSEALRMLWMKACRWTLMAVVPVATLASILGGPFLGFWVSPAFGRACDGLLPILVPGLCLTWVILAIPGAVVQGVGRAGLWSAATLAAVLLNVALSRSFIPRWGLTGASVAIVVAGVTTTVPLLLWVTRRLALEPAQRRVAFPPLMFVWGGVLGAVAWLARSRLHHLITLLMFSAAASGLFAWAIYASVCTPEERRSLRRLIDWSRTTEARTAP